MTHPPYTVLIVDDEAPLRRVLERSLSRAGYRVVSAASAETAYELLATAQANAVLLDIQLPTMSGLALYLAIIHRWPAFEGSIGRRPAMDDREVERDRKSTRLNSSHRCISYAVFCLKKENT